MKELCSNCKTVTEHRAESEPTCTKYVCVICGTVNDMDFDDDAFDSEPCPTCGGEGDAEYQDCPEAWGGDTPDLLNHMIRCPNCGGSGRIEDCDVI